MNNRKKIQNIFRDWALDFNAIRNLEGYYHWIELSQKQTYTDIEIVDILIECRNKIKAQMEIKKAINLLCTHQKAEVKSASNDIADEAYFIIRHIDFLIK